jgi:cytochrome P450
VVDLHDLAASGVCPFDEFRAIMDAGGVAVDSRIDAVVVTGHELARDVSLDPATFSSEREGALRLRMGTSPEPVPPEALELLSRANEEVPALVTADPPAHSRQRRIMNLVFSPRRIAQLEPEIRALAEELFDAFPDREVDFIPAFAEPFPLHVLAHLLAVDRAIMSTVKHWAELIILGMSQPIDAEQRKEVARSVVELQEYFLPRIQARRGAPNKDMLSEVINAVTPTGEQLSDAELLPIVTQLMSAGHATTTHFLSSAIHILAERPALYQELRRSPDDVPAFLEEVLRHSPPVLASLRYASGPTEVCGVPVERRQVVVLHWGSAGRDPEMFEDPDEFVPDRGNARRHLAFGHGPHFCIGAGLARLEADVAFRLLLERYEHVELVPEKSDLRTIQSFAQYGRRKVVVRLG